MAVLTGGVVTKGIADPIGFGATLGPSGALLSITGPTISVSAVPPEGVVTANAGSMCIVNDPSGASVWLKSTGSGAAGWVPLSTGGGSGKGNLDVVQAYFDSTSAADILVSTLSVGDTLESAKLEVFTAFDGVSPSLTLGNPGNHSAYLGTTMIPVSTADEFISGSSLIGVATTLRLYLSLGGSTAGTGRIAISIRRA